MKIEIYKNDQGYDIDFTLQNNDGTAMDISSGSLKFKAQKVGASSLAVDGAMTIVSGEAGTCKYTVQEGDFAEAGQYYAEIEVTIGEKIVTFGNILIIVKNELAR